MNLVAKFLVLLILAALPFGSSAQLPEPVYLPWVSKSQRWPDIRTFLLQKEAENRQKAGIKEINQFLIRGGAKTLQSRYAIDPSGRLVGIDQFSPEGHLEKRTQTVLFEEGFEPKEIETRFFREDGRLKYREKKVFHPSGALTYELRRIRSGEMWETVNKLDAEGRCLQSLTRIWSPPGDVPGDTVSISQSWYQDQPDSLPEFMKSIHKKAGTVIYNPEKQKYFQRSQYLDGWGNVCREVWLEYKGPVHPDSMPLLYDRSGVLQFELEKWKLSLVGDRAQVSDSLYEITQDLAWSWTGKNKKLSSWYWQDSVRHLSGHSFYENQGRKLLKSQNFDPLLGNTQTIYRYNHYGELNMIVTERDTVNVEWSYPVIIPSVFTFISGEGTEYQKTIVESYRNDGRINIRKESYENPNSSRKVREDYHYNSGKVLTAIVKSSGGEEISRTEFEFVKY